MLDLKWFSMKKIVGVMGMMRHLLEYLGSWLGSMVKSSKDWCSLKQVVQDAPSWVVVQISFSEFSILGWSEPFALNMFFFSLKSHGWKNPWVSCSVRNFPCLSAPLRRRRQKEQRLGRDSELLYAPQQRQGGMELKSIACNWTSGCILWFYIFIWILHGFYMDFTVDFTILHGSSLDVFIDCHGPIANQTTDHGTFFPRKIGSRDPEKKNGRLDDGANIWDFDLPSGYD